MICPNCRQPVPDGAHFCGECGMPIEAAGAQQTPQQDSYTAPQTPPQGNYGIPPQAPPQKKKSAAGIIIAAIVALVALIVVLAVVLVGGMLGKDKGNQAAGGTSTKEASTGKTKDSGTTKTKDAPGGKTDDGQTGNTKPADDPDPATKQLGITVVRNELEVTYDLYKPDQTVVMLTYDLMETDRNAPQALQETVDLINGYIEQYYNDYALDHGQEVYDWITNYYGDFGDSGMYYSESSILTVYRADVAILSVAMEDSMFSGGVHPYTDYNGFTIDAQTGDTLTLADVVSDRDALAELAYTEMMKEERYKMLDDALTGSGQDGVLKMTREYLSGGERGEMAFALTNEGIMLLYGDYMLGSYAAGRAEVFVPYAGNEAVFKPQYMESADASDKVETHVSQKTGTIATKDLISWCSEAGVDIESGMTQATDSYNCEGTYYLDGDYELTHITFEADGSFTCYYAHGGIEATGTCTWTSGTDSDFEWTGRLVKADGSTFAEVLYYPFMDVVEINENFYMK